jgi:hypothetical protein
MKKIITLLCCLAGLFAQAQQSRLMVSTESFRPLVVLVQQQDGETALLNSIATLSEKDRNEHHFLLIYGTQTDQATITQAINEALNKDVNYRIDKQKIYLLLLKADAPIRAFLTEQAIFAEVAEATIETDKKTIELTPFLNKFKSKYLWNLEIERIQESGKIVSHKNKRMGIGFVLGSNTQDVFKADTAFLPSRITKMGLSLNYRLSNRWQLSGRLMGSFKLPNQSKIQSTIFSQIDIAAGGEQTIKIEMESHIFFQSDLQANYLHQFHPKLQGFAGVGLAHIFFFSARMSQETTIDVSNFSPGSGAPPGGLDAGGSFDDLPSLSRSFLNPFATVGMNYKLGNRVSLSARLDYHAPPFGKKVVNGVEINQNVNPFSPGLGLQFTFGKTKVSYNYLNSSKKRSKA